MAEFKSNRIDAEILKQAPLLNVSGLAQDIGRTLIVAPHPDDEALGCGGLIALLRAQHTEVHVVFTTSGGASHPNSLAFDTHKLQKLRNLEALQSCAILGVPENHVHFIGLEDSKLHLGQQAQKDKFKDCLASLFEQCEFDTLVTTYRKDAHSDHRATYALCHDFIKQLNRPIQVIEFPIWLWKNGEPEDWPSYDEVEPFRLGIKTVTNLKHKAIYAHESQTTRLINDDPEGFILTEDLLEPFLGPYEYYLFTPNQVKSTLKPTYFKRLYTASQDPWGFRTSAYERNKYLKTLEYLKYYRFKHALEIGCSIGEHSNLLSRHCENLTAIDISQEAIHTAQEKYAHLAIDFKVWNVAEGLPVGQFDLITMCEVGYYLNHEDLSILFENIHRSLEVNGYLLLVHWTSYVREYPLTGRQVHHIFTQLDMVKSNYTQIEFYRHTHYELMLWQKKKN